MKPAVQNPRAGVESTPPTPIPPIPESRHLASPEQMTELSRLLGVNLTSIDDVVSRCRHISVINIEGEDIHFEPGLIHRLKSRCPSNVDFGSWLRARVKDWAHAYVGW